jgi:VWFA-related protein
MKLYPSLAILFSLICVGRAAEPAVQSGQHPSFRTATTLVALQVTVTHGDKLIAGLEANDFAVRDDGIPQQLSFFDSHEIPLDLVLLLDVSASMTDKIQSVHDAAGAFMATLRPHDRGAVIGFNESLKVLQPLTEDHAAIAAAIKRTRPDGTTALRNTLYVALKEFAPRPASADDIRRQAFVLLTDGEDNQSVISYEETLAAAQNSAANIYTIVLRPTQVVDRPHNSTSESDFEMRRLAEETGGTAFFPENIDRLKHVYSTIAAELAAKYSLAYSPTMPAASSQPYHRIDVQVTSNGAYRARTRRGYTDVPVSGHE